MVHPEEDKRFHLGLIQAVANRLSTNSFLIKGWSVVLVSGLFALAASGANRLFVYLAYLPALSFWLLDAYYLWQERLFRALYDDVRLKPPQGIDFSMSVRPFFGVSSWWAAGLSRTILVFHGAIVLTVVFVMLGILILSR